MDRQQILSYYAKWSEGRTQEECAKQWAYVCRLLSIIDEERSSDEYTDWHNYKKYVEEEKLLHKLFVIDNERRRRLKESPNSEKEIYTWYCNKLLELYAYKDEYVKKIKLQYYEYFGQELVVTKKVSIKNKEAAYDKIGALLS